MKLYRGLGGLTLPAGLTVADGLGRRGIMEYGFLSTSANMDMAVNYSGQREGRPHAMVLQLEVDAVNRGASIADFSQFPGAQRPG